jgi:hypothetical protein
MGIYFNRGPNREPGSGLFYQGLRKMDEGGPRNGVFLSETQCGGTLGRAPLLGTLKDMLRKAPDMSISLHRGPFTSKGNLKSGGGFVYREL